VGDAKACGGDALVRVSALQQVGGYRDDLIAGEEPELCVRLRQAGWRIHRLDAEMTLHDAAMTRFGQWWKRSKRAGYAFAQGAWLHGAAPERHWVKETVSALVWGIALPVFLLLVGGLLSPWFFCLATIYPLQLVRLRNIPGGVERAFFLILGKFAEAHGIFSLFVNSSLRKKMKIIEYK
jgi:GT2 family glycosyltransferase